MTALALVLATALLLGALHAFDADHLAAVTTYIARRPSPRRALAFAIRWGLGHSTTLLGVGLVSTLLRIAVTPDIHTAAELAVGGVLIGVGIWVLAGLRRGSLRLEPHTHGDREHTHLHRPDHPERRKDGHSIFWVGALHGLAGSAGLLVVVPVALMSSAWTVAAYIVVFGAGMTAAMSLYALAMGDLLGRLAGGTAHRWYPWVAGAAGSASLLLGLAWVSLTLSARAV